MRVAPLLLIGLSLLACKKKSPEEMETGAAATEGLDSPATADSSASDSSTGSLDGSAASTVDGGQAEAVPAVASGRTLQEQLDEATALLTRKDAVSAERAIGILEPLTSEHPELAGIEYNLGVAYLILDDSLNARKRFLRATEIDPSYSEAWLNMAIMSDEGGDLPRALDKIEAGLRYSPDDSGLVVSRIHLLRRMGRYEDAIETAQTAIKSDGFNLAAYDALGMTYLDQADANPDVADVSRTRADFVYQLARADKSLGADNSTSVHTNLGRLYQAKGWTYEATTEFKRAIDLANEQNSPTVEPYLYLANIDLDNRNYEDARSRLEIARDLAPHDPAIWVNLGIAYRGLGLPDEAVQSYEKALSIEPGNLEPYLNIAVVKADLQNNFADAIAMLEQYRDDGGLNPDLALQWEEQIQKQQKRWESAERSRLRKEKRAREKAEKERLLKEAEAKVAAEEAEKARLEEEAARRAAEEAEAEAAAGAATEGSEASESGGEPGTSVDEPASTEDAPSSGDTSLAPSGEVEAGGTGEPVSPETTEGATPGDAPDAADSESPAGVEVVPDAIEPAPEATEATPDAVESSSGDSEGAVSPATEVEGASADPWGGTVSEPAPSESGQPTGADEASPAADEPTTVVPADGSVWGTDVESVPSSSGSALSSGATCTGIGTCGADDLECAHDAVCRPSFSMGTLTVGTGCLEDVDCAFGLDCVAQVCAEGSSEGSVAPSATPGADPWGGSQ